VSPPSVTAASHTPEQVPTSPFPHTTRPVVRPLAPERYKLQVTLSSEAHARLRQVQDLLRHQVPDGDLCAITERAIGVLLEQLQRKKLAAARRPRTPAASQPASRHVPAAENLELRCRGHNAYESTLSCGVREVLVVREYVEAGGWGTRSGPSWRET
jgi:hypothetical protein